MLTGLWAADLLGYLSHSRKLTTATKEIGMKGSHHAEHCFLICKGGKMLYHNEIMLPLCYC